VDRGLSCGVCPAVSLWKVSICMVLFVDMAVGRGGCVVREKLERSVISSLR
jgi:hypothetical protein